LRAPAEERRVGRYAAPGLFLLAVTIAVLLIRSGLGGGSSSTTTAARGPVRTAPTTTTAAAATTRYYTVQRGDTFGAIAARAGTTIAKLEQLNPGVSSNALHVGQRIRVK
jgi:LysM repeat protein